jgi:hypothetical protein
LLAAPCAGCGGGGDRGGDVAAGAELATAVESPALTAGQEATAGGAAFAVDGNALQFVALPSGHNYYTQLASQVTVRPRDDAAEQLSITFSSIDLRQLDYPAELPGPWPAMFGRVTPPRGIAAGWRSGP